LLQNGAIFILRQSGREHCRVFTTGKRSDYWGTDLNHFAVASVLAGASLTNSLHQILDSTGGSSVSPHQMNPFRQTCLLPEWERVETMVVVERNHRRKLAGFREELGDGSSARPCHCDRPCRLHVSVAPFEFLWTKVHVVPVIWHRVPAAAATGGQQEHWLSRKRRFHCID